MDFYLVDVKSTKGVGNEDVAFDYINTYLDVDKAIEEARRLSEDDDTLEVSVHHWILKEDGSQEHVEDDGHGGILYDFVNEDHREWK